MLCMLRWNHFISNTKEILWLSSSSSSSLKQTVTQRVPPSPGMSSPLTTLYNVGRDRCIEAVFPQNRLFLMFMIIDHRISRLCNQSTNSYRTLSSWSLCYLRNYWLRKLRASGSGLRPGNRTPYLPDLRISKPVSEPLDYNASLNLTRYNMNEVV